MIVRRGIRRSTKHVIETKDLGQSKRGGPTIVNRKKKMRFNLLGCALTFSPPSNHARLAHERRFQELV